MNKFFIPTWEYLMTGKNPIQFINWKEDIRTTNANYDLNKFADLKPEKTTQDALGNFNFYIMTSSENGSSQGVKYNKMIKIKINKNNELLEVFSYDGALTRVTEDNSNIFYCLPIMLGDIIIEIVKLPIYHNMRDKKYLREIAEKYNLQKEMKRFINK